MDPSKNEVALAGYQDDLTAGNGALRESVAGNYASVDGARP